MNAIQDPPSERPIDRWFASYSADHRNDANQWIHVFAVPLILWSVIALLWCIPVPPETGFRAGLWSGLACFAAWMFYFRNSRPIGLGMLAVFVAMLWLTFWIERLQGTRFLLWLAIGATVAVFVAGSNTHRPIPTCLYGANRRIQPKCCCQDCSKDIQGRRDLVQCPGQYRLLAAEPLREAVAMSSRSRSVAMTISRECLK